MAHEPHHFFLVAKSHSSFLSQQHLQSTSSFSLLKHYSTHHPRLPQSFTSGRWCKPSNQSPLLMIDWKAALCPSSRLAEREPRAIRQVPALGAVQVSQWLQVVTSTRLLAGKRPRPPGRASQGQTWSHVVPSSCQQVTESAPQPESALQL